MGQVKATGEIVDLECCELLEDKERNPRTRQEYNKANSTQATCNWLEVRNQAAIAAMQSIISSNVSSLCYDHEFVTRDAIRFADTLVKQLKEG